MPVSLMGPKASVKKFVYDNININARVLDIGAGCGTYADLLQHYTLDAVEVHKPYIEKYKLKEKYNKVINCNIVNIKESDLNYDVVIMGDVLEHLTVEDAKKVIGTLIGSICKHIIVLVPYNYEQGPVDGVESERHLQSDLTREVFLERYSMFKLIEEKEGIGYFRWDRNGNE